MILDHYSYDLLLLLKAFHSLKKGTDYGQSGAAHSFCARLSFILSFMLSRSILEQNERTMNESLKQNPLIYFTPSHEWLSV
jgi:hypothetical protein